jgi:hypothetical protein
MYAFLGAFEIMGLASRIEAAIATVPASLRRRLRVVSRQARSCLLLDRPVASAKGASRVAGLLPTACIFSLVGEGHEGTWDLG